MAYSYWRYYQNRGLLEYRLNHLQDGEVAVLRRYLTTLAELETAIPRASENLDTNQAAVWFRNPNESRDRDNLFDGWRARMCAFLGLPPGIGIRSSTRTLIV